MNAARHGGSDAQGSISLHTAAGLFRSRLVLAARDFTFTQDYVDCAELAVAAGLRETARHLYQLAFLRRGFAPDQLRDQAEVARTTGLWGHGGLEGAATAEAPATGFSVEIALTELRQLTREVVSASAYAKADADGVDAAFFEHLPLPMPLPIAPVSTDTHALEACDALFQLLRLPEAGNGKALAELLGQLRHSIIDAPSRDLVGNIDDLEQLTSRFVFNSLQQFLQGNYQLSYAPYGSAALLHASARLSPGGLGAYLTNVRSVIRTSRDIFALIQLASGGSSKDTLNVAAVERWAVLLATHLPSWAVLDLVDDLGDHGLLRPLAGLLEAAVWRAGLRRDYDVVWRIRDAFIDNGDLALGASAQRIVALWAVNNRVEWTILGEIHATAGDIDRAEAAFAQALEIAPREPGVIERRTAMRAGLFDPFAVRGGFGTPKARQRLRFARQAQVTAAA